MGENSQGLKKFLIILGILLLLFTRFVGPDWGLPYSMHPDERNMVWALEQLSCSSFLNLKECFNPHFFAYGQWPIYLAFFFIKITHFLKGNLELPISFQEGALSLRFISALFSVFNILIIFKTLEIILKPKRDLLFQTSIFLILIFSPYFIQFSHFGTTESILMFFYLASIYLLIKVVPKQLNVRLIFLLSFISGLAIATKLSSIIFAILPFGVIVNEDLLAKKKKIIYKIINFIKHGLLFVFFTTLVSLLFSPHNLISIGDFLSTFHYERDVATGALKVFYTRQFEAGVPILFQAVKIFPFTLGWPQFVLSMAGFIFLSWKDRYINILRFAFLIYFIPAAFLFAKWTRFVSPVFPIMTIFALVFLHRVKNKIPAIIYIVMIALIIIPGIAYLMIYLKPDVRFVASKWIYKNIANNSYILSETANVVDMPVQSKLTANLKNFPSYNYISFNFYDLDQNVSLQEELKAHLAKADYIFVPSRRLFMNHDEKKYPLLTQYYNDLFEGKMKFKEVVEFSSFPSIELFGKKIVEFPDENAEETWTVFDHPVVRIYKRI